MSGSGPVGGSGHVGGRGRGRGSGTLGRVVRAGLGRRRVQTLVMVLTTFVAVTASVVAAGVLTASRAPFDHAMRELRGAHLTVRFDPARVTAAQLAGTGRAAGVTAAAGPFRTLSLSPRTATDAADLPAGVTLPALTVAGRADSRGPVDRLALLDGDWATRPGEIVIADGIAPVRPGTRLEFPELPGRPTLTVVGLARSVTGTADAWVTPAQAETLARRSATTAPAAPAAYQMLYRFRDAATTAQLDADRAALAAAVPPGALSGTRSHLAVRQEQSANALAFVPFVAAFGVLALVLSVLIIGIVVSGAVGAATRRIGVLKALGFTPAQVVRAYVAQAVLPAAAGALLGVVCGHLLAWPVLADVEDAYQGASASIPWWVEVAVPAGALALVAAAALVPALRAGRLRTTEALAGGRASGDGHGGPARRVAARLAARLPVPRPVGLGLAHPFARPARSGVTAAAVGFAAVTVTFAVGLGLTLGAVQNHRMLNATAPVEIDTGRGSAPPGALAVHVGGPSDRPPADPVRVAAALRADRHTDRFYATTQAEVTATGVTGRTPVLAYDGDASWAAPQLVSGRWLGGDGEAVVTRRFLDAAGVRVGDEVTLAGHDRRTAVRITGEAFFTEGDGMRLLTSLGTLRRLDPSAVPERFHVKPSPGLSASAYAASVRTALEPLGATARPAPDRASSVIAAMDALIGTLTALLVAVAGLGVLNTVVLDTRDRVRDLGIMKAVGMTPRQTVAMVLTSTGALGLLAGAAGVPLGVALHHWIAPLMGDAVGMRLPEPDIAVYAPAVTAVLALGGVVIAVAGALAPAGWAARTDTVRALRTE
ncbi:MULTISPECIES: ABC transporter permease [Streptomyces]|uniref:FtsX-like permease family protein n=1 Tax=Streptomyces griseosporeus TaxID=1910 RepID=A0ABV3KHQ1_STRGS